MMPANRGFVVDLKDHWVGLAAKSTRRAQNLKYPKLQLQVLFSPNRPSANGMPRFPKVPRITDFFWMGRLPCSVVGRVTEASHFSPPFRMAVARFSDPSIRPFIADGAVTASLPSSPSGKGTDPRTGVRASSDVRPGPATSPFFHRLSPSPRCFASCERPSSPDPMERQYKYYRFLTTIALRGGESEWENNPATPT